jgi:hypothetical protein
MKADIEGPYGKEVGIEAYRTVLIFATGSSIASVFPFINQLLDGYHKWNVKVRKLVLFWEVESDRGFARQDEESRVLLTCYRAYAVARELDDSNVGIRHRQG